MIFKKCKYWLLILLAFFSAGAFSQDMDIKLRFSDDGEDVPVATRLETASVSPLRIRKNGTNYAIELVVEDHPLATNMRIKTPKDGIKAIKRFAFGPVTFSAAHAPLYYPPTVNNPNYLCDKDNTYCFYGDLNRDGKVCNGSIACSNGIFPIEISSNAMYNPGDKLKIVVPIGELCSRVEKAANPYCWSKSRCCRNCPGVACDSIAATFPYNHHRVKVGFYSSNQASSFNLPIEEHTFSEFLTGGGVVIPAGTKYIYAYFKDDKWVYGDNSLAHSITFYYEINKK